MSNLELTSGDILAITEHGVKPSLTQLAGLSVPNIGPLGRWGIAGASGVGIVCHVDGEFLEYESTFSERLVCVRSGTQTPIGGQAHRVEELATQGVFYNFSVWRYPICYPLYEHERYRLQEVLDYWVGRNISNVGIVLEALSFIGRFPKWYAPIWTPQRLIRFARRKGVIDKPILIS